MAEFHFLRPLWLLLLPVGAWLIWQLLRGRADERRLAQRRRRELAAARARRARGAARQPARAASRRSSAWFVAIVALAGPAWERLPVPAFRSDEALVVALDLSRSMDAGDVEPSRLARAKLKLLDLLERRAAGQTALVVFSTHAFTVTPLTTDTRTIASLVERRRHATSCRRRAARIAAGLDESRGAAAADRAQPRRHPADHGFRGRRRRPRSRAASSRATVSASACSQSAPSKARRFRKPKAASSTTTTAKS